MPASAFSDLSGVFYFAGREPHMTEALREKLAAGIKKNEITHQFIDVRQTNCPDVTRGFNLTSAKDS